MSKHPQQPEIVLFDDEEQQSPNKPPLKKNQQIFVFDDEDCLELDDSFAESHDNYQTAPQPRTMTSEEYRSKCNEIQERIILSNLMNFKQVKKPQGNFFKEAKQKRKSNQMVFQRRKSRCVEEMMFKPKSADVKVDFNPGNSKLSNFVDKKSSINSMSDRLDLSMNEEIVVENITETPLEERKEKRPSLNGACIQKKSELKIQEDKDKNILKVSNFREFLYTQLKPNYSIYLRIKRTENGIINSTYKIYFQENNRFIMSCQKQGFSTYVFSTSQIHISEDHISYLGKMEANFFGTQFLMFDSGEEYSKTKMMENYKKQLAFIEYTQIDDFPRVIETYITTCDNKCTDFTILDKNQNVIEKKWKSIHRRNVCRLVSKNPNFDPQQCNYKLDFRGMAGIPSVKNFIIENEEHSEALIFGRQQDKDSYLMRVKAPFSIMQAVAIAMSSIHRKFL